MVLTTALDETARVLSLAIATLIEMGEAHPAEHIYLAGNGRLSTLVVGRAPLTPDDTRTLDEAVRALQYKTLVSPAGALPTPYTSASCTPGRLMSWCDSCCR